MGAAGHFLNESLLRDFIFWVFGMMQVCPNLLQSSHSLYFISIAKALQVLGYTLEVKGFFLLVCNFHFQLHSCKVSICSILVFCGGCGWGLTRLVAARYKTL
jgi:hypothetical protein